jgi:hypothetical protein
MDRARIVRRALKLNLKERDKWDRIVQPGTARQKKSGDSSSIDL